MSGLFGEEHELFRKSVRAFVEQEIVPHVDEWEKAEEIPRALFRRMGELGFLGVQFPVEYGGAAADFAMSIVLAEELARSRSGGVAFSVIVHTDMSSPWLTRFGTAAQKRRYLPAIARGEIVCALAITEPATGSDMVALGTRARRDGDCWVITGSKIFITNGVYGDLYFVAARTRDEGPRHQRLSQFLVERGTPGFAVSRKLDKTGMWASDTAELAFDAVRVPAANLLGEEGRGFYQLAAGLQQERLMAAVLCVAASRRTLEDCQLYLRQRQTFGRPLAEHQALRHRMADLATAIEAARRLTYHAAERFIAGEDCATEVSMAKLFATETAQRVAYDAVQLHGGYGYMREFPVERFARDYRMWTIASGSSEMMREIIAKRLPV
jgi:alkylation response protein AidB-like acyl-CoA dehydrogenase